jgi:hypothetical protein
MVKAIEYDMERIDCIYPTPLVPLFKSPLFPPYEGGRQIVHNGASLLARRSAGEGEVFISTIFPLSPPPLGKEGEAFVIRAGAPSRCVLPFKGGGGFTGLIQG